ncbi:MAG TPA: hypothetical protein VJ021_05705 [Thermoplasmata archaeon]|nr:hypothetical protein [Thermoplasmata archaeon]
MAAQKAATSEQIMLSTWRRDYRLSLALLVAGIVLVVAISAFSFWANSSGNYPTSFGAGLAIYLIGTAGGMLILLAGTVAYYHWRGLRLSEGTA